jgi:hypothetical protein
MEIYPRTAAERAMKLQGCYEPQRGKSSGGQGAELIGIGDRHVSMAEAA